MPVRPCSGVRRMLTGAIAAAPLTACRGAIDQSALEPGSPQAAAVLDLWWFALAVAAGVYALTIGALFWALWRARRRARLGEALPHDEMRKKSIAVIGAVVATVVILLVFFSYDVSVSRTLRVPAAEPHLLVRVTGRRWWWKVEYPDSNPSRWVTDANEIHIPTGRPVLVELTSNDVIHSLWIPNLGGKKDLIPKYKDTLWFAANRPGVYRGQCAEFCGHQHAKMALHVVAHEPAEFEQWLAHSRQPAPMPGDSLTLRGKEVFLSGPCVLCHAIQGTPAGSRAGPDLTHLASRRTIAAGTLPNTKGNLAAWITDPQGVKPGANMPPNALSPGDLEALLAYLQSLR